MLNRLLFSLWVICAPVGANAFACIGSTVWPWPLDHPQPTEAEVIQKTVELWNDWYGRRDEDALLVVGSFSKKTDVPFHHELILEQIRTAYSERPNDRILPYKFEFTYLHELTFKGHKIIDGRLVPFESDSVSVTINLAAEYEGLLDKLPPFGIDVIGVLDDSYGDSFMARASPCGAYSEVNDRELSAYLEYLATGECQ